jgi:iron complex outermembrane recepter protein
MTRSRKRKLQRNTGRPSAMRALAAGVPTLLAGMSAYAQTTSGGLEEIVVTAQKRTEDLQSVPLSIQAFSTQRLAELNVQRFDDYVRFLPSVSYQTFGPGFASVYMRGVASGGDGNHSGSLPSVGIYLDEQPITTIQGALDVHLYDIQRVEALAGPQGTLYGASSQAGTLRIISNKPDPTEYDASYGLEVNTVEGDMGYLGEGMVNLPISDRAAVRLVGWYRHDAGYIDNVYRERTFPTSGITANNRQFVEDNYNDADTYGARAALRVDLNDNWTITPQLMTQKQETEGSWSYDTSVGDLQIAHGRPELVGRPLDAGGADRRRQGIEPRPGLRGFIPDARRRHRVRLFGLFVLVRHPVRLRRLLVRRQRHADRPVAVHPGQGPLQPLHARTARVLRRRQPLPFRRRPLLPAPGTRHPAALHDRRPR